MPAVEARPPDRHRPSYRIENSGDPGGFIVTLIGIAGAFTGAGSPPVSRPPIQNEFAGLATWDAAIGGSLVPLIAHRLLFGESRD